MKWLKATVVAIFLLTFAIDGYQVYRIAFVKHEADFPAYLAGAEGFRDGTNPYTLRAVPPYSGDDIRPFIYPLFVAWLWVPLAFVPAIVASFIWYILSVAMMLYAIYLCTELLSMRTRNDQWIIFGVIGILFMSVFQWVLMFGQMDLFELLLLVLATKYLVQNKSRSGAFLGAAISAKLMPVVALPMLIKNWRAMAFAILTIFLLCIGIPYLIAGNAIFGYYHYWFHTTLGTEMASGDESVHSFALAGVVAQFLGLVRPTLIIKLACGMFLLIFPLILLFKEKILPALFLSFMLIPLTSTRSEPNHLTMLVPAFMMLTGILLKRKLMWHGKEIQLSTRTANFGWLALIVIQMMILWGYNAIIPFDTMGMLLVFGAVFWEGIHLSSLNGIAPDIGYGKKR